jgi:nucleoside-diphosphate-sugar epimerase
MTTVVVFGGSGFLGRRLVRRLARDGLNVRVAVRHPATFGAPTFAWHGSTAPTSRLRICGMRKAWFARNSPPRCA